MSSKFLAHPAEQRRSSISSQVFLAFNGWFQSSLTVNCKNCHALSNQSAGSSGRLQRIRIVVFGGGLDQEQAAVTDFAKSFEFLVGHGHLDGFSSSKSSGRDNLVWWYVVWCLVLSGLKESPHVECLNVAQHRVNRSTELYRQRIHGSALAHFLLQRFG